MDSNAVKRYIHFFKQIKHAGVENFTRLVFLKKIIMEEISATSLFLIKNNIKHVDKICTSCVLYFAL